jgi:glycosyltransferase involved in cell wall biosynthesis
LDVLLALENLIDRVVTKLLEELGFRSPAAEEIAAAAGQEKEALAGALGGEPATYAPAALLNARPLVSYSGICKGLLLGLASAAGDRLSGRDAWFLLSPTWAVAWDGGAKEYRRRAILYRARHPRHRLIFVVNAQKDVDELREVGEAAFFFNKTASVPEWIFRPLPDATSEFDAIYNAQLCLWKRHELTMAIERCAFVFHRGGAGTSIVEGEQEILRRHRPLPGHVFLNAFDEQGVPVRFSPLDVNAALNRACVGLCLSEIEGAMFAGTEYLLAGLPIVTTPSVGGRDVYFDRDFCLTVPPDPGAVAAAVQALKVRRIPREHIRARTLQRIEADRRRFLEFLNRLLAEAGSRRRLDWPWPFKKPVTMAWVPVQEAIDRAVHGLVDGYHPDDWLPSWRWRRRALHGMRWLRKGFRL